MFSFLFTLIMGMHFSLPVYPANPIRSTDYPVSIHHPVAHPYATGVRVTQ